MDNLESIEVATNNLLSKGIKDDTPTGSTPRKRKWQYTEAWSLTKSRDELLSHRKQQRESADVEMQDANTDEIKTVVSDAANIENDVQPAQITTKPEVAAKETGPIVPLVDSRRRNVSVSRARRPR